MLSWLLIAYWAVWCEALKWNSTSTYRCVNIVKWVTSNRHWIGYFRRFFFRHVYYLCLKFCALNVEKRKKIKEVLRFCAISLLTAICFIVHMVTVRYIAQYIIRNATYDIHKHMWRTKKIPQFTIVLYYFEANEPSLCQFIPFFRNYI